MALQFIPEVWAAQLVVALERAQVFASPVVVNRDYEGDVNGPGDTVHVTSLVDPTIRDYSPHTDIEVDEIDDTDDTFTVDQAKYFSFDVDDLEKRQALDGGVALTEQTRKAAYLLRSQIDTFVGQKIADGASVTEQVGALSDPSEAYEILVLLSQRLDEHDVPENGRYAVVAPDFYSQLLLDNRFVGAGTSGAVLNNGLVGTATGFTILKSNNSPAGDTGKLVVAGNNRAVTYAEALTEVESARRELRFADLVKGLVVYGSKVWRPEQVVTADVAITEEFSS